MNKDNKKNLVCWIKLVASAIIAVSAVATLLNISGGLWPVALPSSGAALSAAVLIFKKGFYDVYKEKK